MGKKTFNKMNYSELDNKTKHFNFWYHYILKPLINKYQIISNEINHLDGPARTRIEWNKTKKKILM